MIDKLFLLYKNATAYEEDFNKNKINLTSIAFVVDDHTIRTQGFIFGDKQPDLNEYVKKDEVLYYVTQPAVNDNKKHVFLTQSQYDLMEEYENDTIYFILESTNGEAYSNRLGGTFPFRFGWIFGSEFPVILN